MLRRYRPDARYAVRVALYFVKLAAYEPFRWLDAFLARRVGLPERL